ncbi:MAG: prolyl oligopeptidase family serine peptidase [Thermoanaerobaculia bacterium]|nr:prolyl oligopeptidase family serine peptidase [Thermoanaerobaculia bacterium]
MSSPSVVAEGTSTEPLVYPLAHRAETFDDYHGTRIADPYRYLESSANPLTKAWVEQQNTLTEKYLSQISSREPIRKRLTELWNFERVSPPVKEGGKYFFTKNDGLQNQPVLFVLDALGKTPRPLLDPNSLAKDGTLALTEFSVSPDGRLLAYATANGGSDWTEWAIRSVETGRDLPDRIKWVKFSEVAWTKGGKGFFYARFDEPARGRELESVNKNQKLYFHRVGDHQDKDQLIYQRPEDPELGFSPKVTEDGRYLVIFIWKGTDRRNLLAVKDLSVPDAPVRPLFEEFESEYLFVDNTGPVFTLKTTKGAPRGRLVSVDISAKPLRLKTVIRQSKDTIESVSSVGSRYVVRVMRDASDRVLIYTRAGKLEKEIRLPALGTTAGFTGKKGDTETFFSFTSFTYPARVYRHDFRTGKTELFHEPRLNGFDPSAFVTEQVFVSSKDGTKVPVFLVYKKGLARDGSAPAYLYGYGGFNVSMTPMFSVKHLVFVERGGIYAQASTRGGGEYGEDWHSAGMKEKKQNVFDDFIASAQWLITNNFTSRKKLAIGGGSNGGLLVGAVLNQRPELFGAAVPAVGVMDMLRFHKFTIGWAWVSEYGSSDDPAQFRLLLSYSPLHNIRTDVPYPAVLITTADTDDRVVPAHSYKYAAALQQAQTGRAPVLIRIETKAGHGAGKPTNKQIEEAADVLAFLDVNLRE